MGCYNTVVYTCPNCGSEMEDQTKSGGCDLRTFHYHSVPIEDVAGLDDHIYCSNCDTGFEVVKQSRVRLELVSENHYGKYD